MTHTEHPAHMPDVTQPNGFDPAAAPPPYSNPLETAEGKSSEVARQIDENLKRMFKKHLEQELPPDLEALVARLRGRELSPDTDDDEEES